jgi:hypothetical protein
MTDPVVETLSEIPASTAADLIEELGEINDENDADLRVLAETPHGTYLFDIRALEVRDIDEETVVVMRLLEVKK